MTIPFVDLFIKAKTRLLDLVATKTPAPPSPIMRVQKPVDQRLSKTVLPNTTRARPAMDPFQAAANSGTKSAVAIPGSKIFETSQKSPPRIAVTPEPMVERTISLQLSEILDELPSQSVKPADSFDPSRAIILRASDLEKGMASGKPSVSLSTIYQQVPEIFLNNVAPGDTTPVSLPFIKVLEQFNSLQIRPDQENDADVPQLETPFLKVTLEDTQRFGTAMEPLQTSPLPPVKVEPATAKTIAAAEPEPVVRSASARPKIALRDLGGLSSTPSNFVPPPSPFKKEETDNVTPTPALKKIPFDLPPNGTGEPASERVPASSGPPVPTIANLGRSTITKRESDPSPSVETPAGNISEPEHRKVPLESGTASITPKPARIPFKFSAPSDDIRPKLTLVPGVEPKGKAPEPEPLRPAADNRDSSKAAKEEAKIVLSLQSLLAQVPAFQLSGSPMGVPEDAKVAFPLALIEPQLASGRVVIPGKTFQRAIPEAYRSLFIIDPNETPVSLPLYEIVKHLPPTALRMRDDQEGTIPKEKFTTPFSIQAEEDAKRFSAMAAALQEAPQDVTQEPCEQESIDQAKIVDRSSPEDAPEQREAPRSGPIDSKPAEELSKPETLDAKTAVVRARELPGVAGCTITFADGLGLAGDVSAQLATEGISAMAASLLQRIDILLDDTNLGGLVAMTLHCSESTLTFFRHGNICLTALHANGMELTPKTRSQLSELTQELSQTYPQVELSHVDH